MSDSRTRRSVGPDRRVAQESCLGTLHKGPRARAEFVGIHIRNVGNVRLDALHERGPLVFSRAHVREDGAPVPRWKSGGVEHVRRVFSGNDAGRLHLRACLE